MLNIVILAAVIRLLNALQQWLQ